MKQFDKIFVINLERRRDRWEAFEKHAKEVGFTGYERFNAVDGSKRADFLALPEKFRGFEGSLGCLHSHWEIARYVRKNGWIRVLVLEDDCRFNASLLDIGAWIGRRLHVGAAQIHFGDAEANHGVRIGLRGWSKNVMNTHAYVMGLDLAEMIDDELMHRPFPSDLTIHPDRLIWSLLEKRGLWQLCPPPGNDFCIQDKSVTTDVKWGFPDKNL